MASSKPNVGVGSEPVDPIHARSPARGGSRARAARAAHLPGVRIAGRRARRVLLEWRPLSSCGIVGAMSDITLTGEQAGAVIGRLVDAAITDLHYLGVQAGDDHDEARAALRRVRERLAELEAFVR
jgi:hypothetical protein